MALHLPFDAASTGLSRRRAHACVCASEGGEKKETGFSGREENIEGEEEVRCWAWVWAGSSMSAPVRRQDLAASETASLVPP